MHELGIMNDVLDTAVRVAKENSGRRVTKIVLKIGVMSGVVDTYVQSFFDLISKGTIAEGAEVEIDSDPAVFRCCKCGMTTVYDKLGPEYACHACGSESLRLISGHGFQIVSVAIV